MRYEASSIKGLTPAIDPRRSRELFALSGKNYAFDALGPKSPFGNRFLTPYPIGIPDYVESVRLKLRTGDRVFVLTADSILEWSESDGGWRVIYYYADISSQPYRWTYGFLNGIMFFCHPAVGILAYRVDVDDCQPLTTPGTPSQPISIAINNGRLIVMDELNLSWSGPGDGTDFVPRLGGAGFQKINERVPGTPIMVVSYGRGVFTWTTGGIMRSEFTGDAEVFRHRELITEYRPVNSFCTFKLDRNTIGVLDERGFFSSQGELPTPLTPLFNEFLIDYVQKYNLKFGENIRVEWDELQRRLYLSYSLSESQPIYENAFVLYVPLDIWGQFNEEHYGVGPLLINDSTRGDDYYGFVDNQARVKFWQHAASREILPIEQNLNSRYPLIQKPPVKETGDDVLILASSAVTNTINEIQYSQRAGYYGPTGTSPWPHNLESLDAKIKLGLIRVRDSENYDRMIEVQRIFIGNVLSGNELVVTEDFNLVPDGESDEDFNIVSGAEDFGVDDINYVNHGLRIFGSVDGNSEFDSVIPELVEFKKGGRHFSGSVKGIWHGLEISAENLGEAFHIKSLELNGIDGGLYT